MPSPPPGFPRLPSVWDGPLGPTRDAGDDGRRQTPRPRPRRPDAAPRPKLPAVEPFMPLAEKADIEAAIGKTAALSVAYQAVLRELGGPVPPQATAAHAVVPEDPAAHSAVQEPQGAPSRTSEEGPPPGQPHPPRALPRLDAEPRPDPQDPDAPDSSPDAAILAIAAILEEESRELLLPGHAVPPPSSRTPPGPATVAVAPDIAEWFAGRGLDLADKTDALLRRYIRESDRRGRKPR